MVGLRDINNQFEPLQEMAKAAVELGAKGSFEHWNKTAVSMSSAISSMVTSAMESRVALQQGGGRGHIECKLTSEIESFPKCKLNYFRILGHKVYCPKWKHWLNDSMLLFAAISSYTDEALERIGHHHTSPSIGTILKRAQSEWHFVATFPIQIVDSTKGLVFKERHDC
jgi:hypothetical protein